MENEMEAGTICYIYPTHKGLQFIENLIQYLTRTPITLL